MFGDLGAEKVRKVPTIFHVNCRVPKGGVFKGRGNWGTLRIPREDWGTLGNIRED